MRRGSTDRGLGVRESCRTPGKLGRFHYEHRDGFTVCALSEPRVNDAELPVAAERDRVARPPNGEASVSTDAGARVECLQGQKAASVR